MFLIEHVFLPLGGGCDAGHPPLASWAFAWSSALIGPWLHPSTPLSIESRGAWKSGKRRNRMQANKDGFQAGQTAKARQGPPCAVTPFRDMPPAKYAYPSELTLQLFISWIV